MPPQAPLPEPSDPLTARRSTWEQDVVATHLVDRPDLSVDHLSLVPGAGLKMHSHSRCRQYFHVLRGEVTFVLGPRTTTVGEGSGVEIPPRLRHLVRNDSDTEAELLLTSAPRPSGAPRMAQSSRQVHRARGRVVVGSYLRRTRTSDLPTIVAVEEDVDTRRWVGQGGLDWHASVLTDPDMEHWVLVDRLDRIVAYGILAGVSRPGHVEIRRTVVAPEGRGQGLGRLLLRHLLEHARARPSVRRVWLDVGRDNTRARSLYRSFGFVEKPTPSWATLLDNGLYMEFNAEPS